MNLRWQLLVVTVFALVVAAVVAFFIAATVTRPLARMVDYVRRVGAGDYGGEAPSVNDGEIGILAREFFTMRSDIAERERAIRHLAYHDTLTELPNRNQFRVTVRDAIDTIKLDRHLVVLIMDLDDFKDINDTLGHMAGDQLLREVAGRLEAVCRPEDRIARLGGDEFAVMIGEAERREIIPLTMHYRDALAMPFEIEGITLHVNCTVGIAVYPENGENADTLLQRADVAMYVGKENHLPFCLYNAREDRHNLLRLTLMSELKSAIERDELTLYYQPKLELSTSRVTAVECLVRWIHPRHGFVSPDDFIPLAEQTGNVSHLTTWVLETALAQRARWQARGLHLKVAVNVSAVDLQDTQFLARLDAALQRHGQAPGVLALEITESAIMRNPEQAVQQLRQLNEMGVKISIDDFGTGYSSMAQLKHLPVHELKIDKSFVLDIAENPDDAIIVRSTVELGHNMGLEVVAEGVESKRVLEILQSYGCDWVQGYHLSKPLPAAEFEAWLHDSPYHRNRDRDRQPRKLMP
jgi:diguanylate cyclase (GGDEF)-like protein